MKLVIVESPAKAKTIGKYLGKGFQVLASNGHVRDLPASKLSVDVDKGYEPHYMNMRTKTKVIASLKAAAKKSEMIYLATDPDREGEAIAFHLAQILGLKQNEKNRISFNEITEKGVKDGIKSPRTIDDDTFKAQQARRVLDRVVGYTLSPFLWKKVGKGLSAGRVQSVTVRLVVDREKEIEAFVPVEYWNIDAKLETEEKKPLTARFYGSNGEKISVTCEAQAKTIEQELKGRKFVVEQLKEGKRKRVPSPPFITSTLQQDASRKLGFTQNRTMRAAQTLYEGVDITGKDTIGLITYMRTDSLRIADEAAQGAAEFIKKKYGAKYLPPKQRAFKSKKGKVQDAHEAIRPTFPSLTPEEAEKSISGDTAKLYRLIWNRFTASQMADCETDTVSLTVSADCGSINHQFKTSGFIVTFDGFTVLYEESSDDKKETEKSLPKLTVGQLLQLKKLSLEQKFTEPPPRYNDASIVKALEENGIGRPSTYAPIITTIIDRGYVERLEKKLRPTELGRVVTQLMQERFTKIVDVAFSAQMEEGLDKIESGEEQWVTLIDGVYKYLISTLEQAEKALEGVRLKPKEEVTDVICELCGKNMVVKTSKYGKFLGCPGFPECKNLKKIEPETKGSCPECGSPLHFRKSKTGRSFYGCSAYPNCSFLSNDAPTDDKCEKCGSTLFKKLGKTPRKYCKKCESEAVKEKTEKI